MKNILLLLFTTAAFAQPPVSISSDRPGVSIGTAVVGKKVFQIESGYEFNKSNQGNTEVENSFINNVLRYGLGEKYELSTSFDYNSLNDEDSTLGNFQVGGRVNLYSPKKGMLPTVTLQSRLQFYDSLGEKTDNIETITTLSSVFDLKEYGAITLNFIVSDISRDSLELSTYIASWSRDLSDEFNFFIEYYANKSDSKYQSSWDTGFGYLLNKDTWLDISFGTDLEAEYSSKFYALGFSWRKL